MRNITKVILITHTKIPTYNIRAKEIALEDVMAASVQPPVIFWMFCFVCQNVL